jgi:hypothetical protein
VRELLSDFFFLKLIKQAKTSFLSDRQSEGESERESEGKSNMMLFVSILCCIIII